jgi:pimeloyl-[acyl-carrier protein] synthase
MMPIVHKSTFSLSSEKFIENPYPFYEEMRAIDPVYWNDSFLYPGWYVTGYEEALRILKNKKFQNRVPVPEASGRFKNLTNVQSNMLLFKNQPDHQRLRKLISDVFTPGMVESYRPAIEKTVEELLEDIKHKEEIDVAADYAFPLPSLIIAGILGVPKEEMYRFKQWAADLLQSADFTRSRRVLKKGEKTMAEVSDFFSELVEERKKEPRNDLISRLIESQDQGSTLTDDELTATCILLTIAGHETTVNMINNSVLSLVQHPEQLKQLKEDSSLIDRTMEECLRFESPTQMIARSASEDCTINGEHTIKKGEQVYVLLGAANRDPRKFSRPGKFNIKRKEAAHIAFGSGSHFCLGAPLARLEAKIAVQVLLPYLPAGQPVSSEVQWRRLTGFRALKTLPIKLEN